MSASQDQIIQSMKQTGLVPVFNHADLNTAKHVLDACYDAGIRVFEFTNRGTHSLEVFEDLASHAKEYEDLYLGIGTIMNAKDAEDFVAAGATFLVSPALIPEIAVFGEEHNMLWIPGCGTVTEIHKALELGAKMVKAFPGNVLGAGFVKSVRAVFPDLLIMPTGGVTPTNENLKAWFGAGVHCVGMGSQLFKKELLASGNLAALKNKLVEALNIIRELKATI